MMSISLWTAANAKTNLAPPRVKARAQPLGKSSSMARLRRAADCRECRNYRSALHPFRPRDEIPDRDSTAYLQHLELMPLPQKGSANDAESC